MLGMNPGLCNVCTGSADFRFVHWIRILDPDPAIFVINLQDASQKLIFSA
jgi:hypothetical protein